MTGGDMTGGDMTGGDMTGGDMTGGDSTSEPSRVLDERGTLCPLPVIALGRAIKEVPPGSLVELLADDPAAAHDVPAWCQMRGAELVMAEQDENGFRFLIRSAQ